METLIAGNEPPHTSIPTSAMSEPQKSSSNIEGARTKDIDVEGKDSASATQTTSPSRDIALTEDMCSRLLSLTYTWHIAYVVLQDTNTPSSHAVEFLDVDHGNIEPVTDVPEIDEAGNLEPEFTDSDSAYEGDSIDDTSTLSSHIMKYREENGRTYHSYGKYKTSYQLLILKFKG